MSQETNIKYDINTGDYGWGESINSNFKIIDSLLFPLVQDSIQGTPPEYKSGITKECYIVAGALNGIDASINTLLIPTNTGWATYTPKLGSTVYHNTAKQFQTFNGSAWIPLSQFIGFDDLTNLTNTQVDKLTKLNALTNTSLNSIADSISSIKVRVSALEDSSKYLATVVSNNKADTDSKIATLSSTLDSRTNDINNNITDIKASYFLASGSMTPELIKSVDWNSNSGVYTIDNTTETKSIVQFKGSGSAPALQLQYTYANKGLWYKSARDNLGFEKDFERIVTEGGGIATLASKLATARKVNGFSFDGSSDINITNIAATDNRSMKPSDVSGSKLALTLVDRGQIDSNVKGSDLSDALSLDSFNDNTAGRPNLLVMSRNNQAIYHYVATGWNGSQWFSPKQIAYTDSSITGNSSTATALQTPRRLNGTYFDGSYDVSIPVNNTIISRGSDLNLVTTPGFYSCLLNSEAITMVNKPEEGSFSLLVEAAATYKQTFTNYSNGNTYIRMYVAGNNSWSSWRSILFSDSDGANSAITAQRLFYARKINSVPFDGSKDITISDDTKVPLAGGTMTGELKAPTLTSTGDVNTGSGYLKSDSNHYIKVGKPLDDTSVLATWGGNFSFVDTTSNTEVVGINGASIKADGLRSKANDLILGCNGDKWVYLQAGNKSATYRGDGSFVADTFVGNLTGTASYANQLSTARNININGVISGKVSFKGDSDVTITTTYTDDSSSVSNYSKNSNGYVKLTGGLILQWGSVDYTSNPGEMQDTATFPIAFPNNCLQAITTRKMAFHSAGGDTSCQYISSTPTTLTVSLQVINSSSTAESRGWSYFAIGW